ncbi:MAG: LD-carboxypeptidase, partial [Pseudomonadota bacterium]|nr:LD-carboxypeptidase [Pseudomonadota bacterium]
MLKLLLFLTFFGAADHSAFVHAVPSPVVVSEQATIKIITTGFLPASTWRYKQNINILRKAGYDVRLSIPANTRLEERERALLYAMLDKDGVDCENYVCLRGGFGSSDLLDRIPYDELIGTNKRVFGYSDVTSVQSALWTKSGLVSFHAPMIATGTWRSLNAPEMQTLTGIMNGTTSAGTIPLLPRNASSSDDSGDVNEPLEGILYGGTFSVLTNLIGTPYMPASLDGYILFIEDTGESHHRLIRYFNQWLQSGMLDGVRAIILGNFGKFSNKQRTWLRQAFEKRA